MEAVQNLWSCGGLSHPVLLTSFGFPGCGLFVLYIYREIDLYALVAISSTHACIGGPVSMGFTCVDPRSYYVWHVLLLSLSLNSLSFPVTEIPHSLLLWEPICSLFFYICSE